MRECEEVIGYHFKNKLLLKEALTHPSFKKMAKNNLSYQRLEFLGDKVLGFVMAEALVRHFPLENEGELSKRLASIICKHSLALVAQNLNLGSFIILGKSQISEGGRENKNILENTVEAIIGAIFLDSGVANAKKFILTHFKAILENANNTRPEQDPKSAFQEWFQKKYKSLPEYSVTQSSTGEFVAKLKFNGFEFEGKAKSIKEAQKNSAQKALNQLPISQ